MNKSSFLLLFFLFTLCITSVYSQDGSVVTWGNSSYGGSSSTVSSSISSGVTNIFSTSIAFAALKSDGSVVTWGNSSYGGNSSSVSSSISSGVTNIFSTDSAFAALKQTPPTVTLTDTDSDNIVAGANVVTITATFSEAMAVTPTINIIGEVSNAMMTASSTASVWIYPWTVSNNANRTVSVTILGLDLSGNHLIDSFEIFFRIILASWMPCKTLRPE